ncbi:lipoprotein-releasing ABC transporter permease subunit [Gammaproteobacteria bacterium]|nr:lipoprotein-releasing ABC transporter permease subunit [Gammaproteobacteria bacterium]MDA9814852.1 lipoprotein-releasing ABC transporter permease subunit [Gammaproteobacteria bacterium]MDA9903006.1 lipoprotein-releasing ABC transporter permease subunit [Gammaproteobacteria bacterium]MDB4848318.1 lipoprotein-releasing ABC transporter permease subunit [Gammaproteobacteria bacterium]MDC0402198.1 lipoprotein-releasing ABC transporter permease subunit [Gammaproteobacteria bacterium]
MFKLPLRLAFKYFKSNKGGVFSFTSFLAITGLTIGVSSLIIVMSVMNGFEKELQDRILGVVPHAVIYSDEPINDYESLIDQLKLADGVEEAVPYISFQALITSNSISKGVSVNGIDVDHEDRVSILPDYMLYGSLEDLSKDNSIVIGSWLASYLGIFVGDSITITTSDIKSSIIGSYPRSINLQVVGIFELRAEIDQSLVLISHELAQKFKSLTDETLSIRLKTSNLFLADQIAYLAIPDNTSLMSSSWKETHGTLFEAIQFEKLLISLMLFLIVAVASILVLSTIVMTVKSKEREVGILKTIGANNQQLVMIFFFQGLMVSFIGLLMGLLLGLIVTFNINNFITFLEGVMGRNLLEAYFINYFPYYIDYEQIGFICLISLIFSLLASLFPALRVTKLNPIEILRHE